MEKPGRPAASSVTSMCIAFDGAYILEAPPSDPGPADEDAPATEIITADAEPENLCPT